MGKLKIISFTEEIFKNRKEAGELLSKHLKGFKGPDTVVLGIPRGGVIIANEVAAYLDSELDVIVSHKLGAPGNPEFAIGSINEEGKIFLNEPFISRAGADKNFLDAEETHQLSEIKNRIDKYRSFRKKVLLKDKDVIVVDDGIATGATLEASLIAARHEKPSRLIAAVPLSAQENAQRVSFYCDELIVLRAPVFLSAISQYYNDFRQTTDDEVIEILKTASRKN